MRFNATFHFLCEVVKIANSEMNYVIIYVNTCVIKWDNSIENQFPFLAYWCSCNVFSIFRKNYYYLIINDSRRFILKKSLSKRLIIVFIDKICFYNYIHIFISSKHPYVIFVRIKQENVLLSQRNKSFKPVKY